jgi:hypothetical protein
MVSLTSQKLETGAHVRQFGRDTWRYYNIPRAFQPLLQIRTRNSITRTKCGLQLFTDSFHPSSNVDSELLIALVLEAICNVVCPICFGATGMVFLRVRAAASGSEEAGSRVDF